MAKYINKFKDENEYNDKKMSLNYPSINYVESLDEIVWLKEMPPFKYYITDLDGNVIFSMPFDENDTTLHYSDLQEFNNAWYNGASYGDFVIGEGITGGDDQLFFYYQPSNSQKFFVNRFVIPSTWDNRVMDEHEEYKYCEPEKYPFGFWYVKNGFVYACGIVPRSVYIEKGAQLWSLFSYAPIEQIDLSNFEYEGQNISKMFLYSTDLKTAILPSGITSLDCYAFYGCYSLSSFTIPSSVTSICESAFYRCYSLTDITIPNSVTSIGANAFSDCSGLTSVTIPNSVTSIGEGAFSDCNNLTSVTIPSSVTSIGRYTFNGCTSLSSLTIPNSVTSIGEGAFYNCNNLTSVTIPSSVTSIGGNVLKCNNETSLQSIIVEATTPPTLGLDAFNGTNNCPLYVPQSVVNDYKSAPRWNTYADRISGYVYDWQTLQDDYICESGDKYEKEELVLNVENGTNYVHTATYRKGSLIESGSTDCFPIEGLLINYNAKQYDATESMLPKTEGQLYDENAYVVDADDNPVGNILNVDHLEIDGNMIARLETQLFNRTDNIENNEYELTVIAKVNPSGDSVTLFGNRDSEGTYNWMFRTRADSFVLHGNDEVDPMSVTYPNIIHARVYEENGELVYNECNMNENSCLGSRYGFAYGSEVQNGAALFSDLYEGPNYESFQGAFYWIAIYNRALTEEEIEEVINYNENL